MKREPGEYRVLFFHTVKTEKRKRRERIENNEKQKYRELKNIKTIEKTNENCEFHIGNACHA